MAQIIVVSSINHQSGKTLLAAHLAVMLSKDYKTAVFDSAGENSPLAKFIAQRYNLGLSKNITMHLPAYHTLLKSDFKELAEKYDAVILDAPDSSFFAKADVLITPVAQAAGLEAVSSANTMFASLVWDAKKRRAAEGKNAFRWVVVPNDDLTPQDYDRLSKTGKMSGFEVSPRLPRRDELAQGLKTGITVMDKDQQNLKNLFVMPDFYARRDLKKLADFIWQNK